MTKLLSAIVITKNEEEVIERCLKSLHFVDEIIVVDDHSTDTTSQKAQQHGARVITNTWPGYGAQKNHGAEFATSEWVLFIDADEVVTPQLAQEILQTIKDPDHNFYWLKIETFFLGRPLRHLIGHNLRLFRRQAGKWTTDAVHEQVQTNSGTRLKLGTTQAGILKNTLLHYSHSSIRSYLTSMHRYTTLDAQQMKKTGRHRSGRPIKASWYLPLTLGARQLIKLLFYRGGIADGPTGILWSILSSYYEVEMAYKFLKNAQ